MDLSSTIFKKIQEFIFIKKDQRLILV